MLQTFFDAIEAEDLATLTRLFGSSGGQFLSGGLGAQTPVELWRQRFRLFDYSKLRGTGFARLGEASLVRARDAEGIPKGNLEDFDVVVRVPIVATQGPGEPVIGSGVVLLIRHTGKDTTIAAYDEARN